MTKSGAHQNKKDQGKAMREKSKPLLQAVAAERASTFHRKLIFVLATLLRRALAARKHAHNVLHCAPSSQCLYKQERRKGVIGVGVV
jgi:hypothetical protein